jgi:hypothetical protein
VVQAHPDFVADLELSIVWLLLGWHAKEGTPLQSKQQGSGTRVTRVRFAGRRQVTDSPVTTYRTLSLLWRICLSRFLFREINFKRHGVLRFI